MGSPPITAERTDLLRHVLVGGLPIMDGDITDATNLCLYRIANGLGTHVATANLDFLALSRGNRMLRNDLHNAHLVVADGAPVAVLARVAGARSARRVAGVDLVQALLAGHGLDELRVAMYGASEEASASAARRIGGYERVSVVARIVPPFRPLSADEEQEYRESLRAAAPHLVLVALGCPKQERFIATSFDAAPAATWIGVGGTFEFLGGLRHRAPRWAQSAGMEWLVRLAQEPTRLWSRYLLRDIPALGAIVASTAVHRLRYRTLP